MNGFTLVNNMGDFTRNSLYPELKLCTSTLEVLPLMCPFCLGPEIILAYQGLYSSVEEPQTLGLA